MQGPEPHTPSQNFSAAQLGPKLASTLTVKHVCKTSAPHCTNTCDMSN